MLDFLAFALLAVAITNTAILYRIGRNLQLLTTSADTWKRQSQADTDLQAGKWDDVIARCLKDIEKSPLHGKTHWYLGRAYYAKGFWEKAREQMELVSRLEPSWRRDSIEPYLQEIERQLQVSTKDEP